MIASSSLDGACVLLAGGTGSLGQHLTRRLLERGTKLVRIFSRDEKKQLDMQRDLGGSPHLDFMIGDVRDRRRVREAVRGIDIVINAAALKQVPVCEHAPVEAISTNVTGVINLVEEAVAAGVKSFLAVSTDKAVKPVNVLGMTKALQEKIVLQRATRGCATRLLAVRYGNVLGSRGSVVPFFCSRVRQGLPIPITDRAMTRFILTLDDAVEAIFSALSNGRSGQIWVRRSAAVRVEDLARTIAQGLAGSREYPIEEIGIRPGEKIHEILISFEEVPDTRANGLYFIIAKGETLPGSSPEFNEYSSATEERFSGEQIHSLLEDNGWLEQEYPEVQEASGL